MTTVKRLKRKEPVNIDVELDVQLTVPACVKLVEDFLKYILYQRHQIPVQLDVLTREVKNAELQDNSTPADYDDDCTGTQDGSRRETLARRSYQRRRQRWLAKVQDFLNCYTQLVKILKAEIEEGGVCAVHIIVGNSVLTSKEVYSVMLPRDCSLMPAVDSSNFRIISHFFRTLVTHEGLVELVTKPCSVQKVWVMLQKSHCSCASPTSLCSVGLTPCDEYVPNMRAQTATITVTHAAPKGTSMDMTPVSGVVTHHQKVSNSESAQCVKRTLSFSKQSFWLYSSGEQSGNCDSGEDTCLCDLCYSNNWRKVRAVSCSTSESPFPSTPFQSNGVTETYKTPLTVKKVIPMVETPTVPSVVLLNNLTPSKILSAQLDNFSLSDNNGTNSEATAFFQIDIFIKGFKDTVLDSDSNRPALTHPGSGFC